MKLSQMTLQNGDMVVTLTLPIDKHIDLSVGAGGIQLDIFGATLENVQLALDYAKIVKA